MTIENAGNIETTFDIALNDIAHVTATLPFTQVVLPPNGQVVLPVNITSDFTGMYGLIATVTGGATPVQANLTLNVNLAPWLIYILTLSHNLLYFSTAKDCAHLGRFLARTLAAVISIALFPSNPFIPIEGRFLRRCHPHAVE